STSFLRSTPSWFTHSTSGPSSTSPAVSESDRGRGVGKHTELLDAANKHVFELFRCAKPDNPLVYHTFKRTPELVDACWESAKKSKLDEEECEILLLGAWFRDAGFASGLDGDRGKSVVVLREFLEQNGKEPEFCEAVTACISAASAMPYHPNGVVRDDILHD